MARDKDAKANDKDQVAHEHEAAEPDGEREHHDVKGVQGQTRGPGKVGVEPGASDLFLQAGDHRGLQTHDGQEPGPHGVAEEGHVGAVVVAGQVAGVPIVERDHRGSGRKRLGVWMWAIVRRLRDGQSHDFFAPSKVGMYEAARNGIGCQVESSKETEKKNMIRRYHKKKVSIRLGRSNGSSGDDMWWCADDPGVTGRWAGPHGRRGKRSLLFPRHSPRLWDLQTPAGLDRVS